MQPQGRTQDAARRPAHRYTQSEPEDRLQRAQVEQSASSFFRSHLARQPAIPPSLHGAPPQTHLCMCPRADLRRRFHNLHLALTLHASQRTDERRKRFPLRH